MKIVALDSYAVNPGDLLWNELKSLGKCIIYNNITSSEVTERTAGADILPTDKVMSSADATAVLSHLKYVGVFATGYNVIGIVAAKERGIIVTNISAYNTPSIAQMVFAYVLNIVQQTRYYTDEVHKDRWSSDPDLCFWDTLFIESRDKKIGITGLGQAGHNAARIATGLGMEVHVYASKSTFQLPPKTKETELDELFANCNIISLHCPLIDSTRELASVARLKQMKSNAILINIGRDPLISEQDFADALNNGTILVAGLDALSQGPPRLDNPLLVVKNCYITPHIAWASVAARERLMQTMLDNVRAFLDGKVINAVTKQKRITKP